MQAQVPNLDPEEGELRTLDVAQDQATLYKVFDPSLSFISP